jgi:CO/xanthine dehydrogenase FAD-binding subunit
VKAPPFAYARARSTDDALMLLAEAGDDAKVLAGGQSMLPLLAYRLIRPTHLVDVGGLARLSAPSAGDGELVVDALVRHAELERMPLTGAQGLLAEAAGLIGHVPIRTRGTLGGSLAHADPAAELPVAAVALDASIVARSAAAERRIPAASFFLAPFMTALEPYELVTGLAVPAAPRGAGAAFTEFAVRAGDFALASAAVVIACEGGLIDHVRIVLGGVDAIPLRVSAAEELLIGAAPGADAFASAAAAASAACDPVSDQRGSAQYRRELVAAMVRGSLTRACERCVA